MIDIDRIYNEDCLEGMKRIGDNAVGINDLIRDFEKFTGKDYRLASRIAFGFIEWQDEDQVIAIQDSALWHHGKQVVLMVAGSRVHKAIVAEELRHGIRFERISEETMLKIYPKTHFRFTDEDSKNICIAKMPLQGLAAQPVIKLPGNIDLLQDILEDVKGLYQIKAGKQKQKLWQK